MLVPILLMAQVAGGMDSQVLRSLERFAYDARLKLTMPGGVDERIVIVDIDEASLQQEGHWPWSRDKLALLLDQLFERYGADVVAFDVVFAEADQSSGLPVLQRLQSQQLHDQAGYKAALAALEPELNYDQRFANSMQGRRVVLGYYFRHDGEASHNIGLLPPAALDASVLQAMPHMAVMAANGYGANLPQLQQQAAAAGHFNPEPDDDGITRRVPLLVQHGDGLYESLALAVTRLALGEPHLTAGIEQSAGYNSLEWIGLGQRRLPVDANITALIPYRGPQGSFSYIAASDVLHGRAPLSALKSKIVLVGTSAPGLMDLRATPVQSVYPGVEVHANMIAGMLDGNLRHAPDYRTGAEILLLVILGLSLAYYLPALSPLAGTVLSLAVLLGLVTGNLVLWRAGLDLPLASPLLAVVLIYVLNVSYGYFIESRSKRHLTQLFGQYVPPALVSEMAAQPVNFGLEGENRQMTVLFCDIRGFTSISETLAPQELAQLMNEYLSAMTRVIHQHRGTIDKYMGDAIMAFWGAPLQDEQHASHAVAAALGMMQALQEVNAAFYQKGWPRLEIGVGLNSGEMTVGNMGSEFRMAYTVLGDAVNLGARLESLSPFYGEPVILSGAVCLAAPQYHYRELDLVQVKGKDAAVRLFTPILAMDWEPDAAQAVPSAQAVLESEQYAQALLHYREQNWQEAQQAFLDLQSRYGERRIHHIYLARIAHFASQPPGPEWLGIHRFDSKQGAA